jgi:hypothetical protein
VAKKAPGRVSGGTPSEMGAGDQLDSGSLVPELAAMRTEVERLRAENVRLLRLLELSPREARPPGPAQLGFFEARPGPVHAGSPADQKVAFFAALFGARTDVYATRWENTRTGKAGWLPAVAGGWRRGSRHEPGASTSDPPESDQHQWFAIQLDVQEPRATSCRS